MKRILSVLTVIILMLSALSTLCFADGTAQSNMMLHVEGNQLIRADGTAIRLLGMNIPYTSWSDNCESQVMAAFDISEDMWKSNVVRYAVTPKLWFGVNSDSYRALADTVIEKMAQLGKYVILDNHSFYLPDEDDIKFWKDAATRYKDKENVIFELFNEPAGCTWQQYYEGGTLRYKGKNDWGEDADVTVNSCGIPELFKTVRATGAKNICILPGINWSFDLSCCTEKDFEEFAESIAESEGADKKTFVKEYKEKYFIKETFGNGIMYSTHPYPTKPLDRIDDYLKNTILEYPVFVGECGPTEKDSGFIRVLSDNDKSYLDTLSSYIDKFELHLTPWAWGAWPFLNREPSDKLSAYGEYMLDYFEKSIKVKAITLYDEVDYKGNSITVEAGKYNKKMLDSLGIKISDIRSVSVKDDYYQYEISLYSKDDFKGDKYTFVPKSANIDEKICGFKPVSMTVTRSVPENFLTKHAEITATGNEENQPPENLIDGKTGTYWYNKNNDVSEIVLSLDDVYAINGITLAHAAEASMMSVYNASDYTVSVSTDGKAFTRIIDVTDNTMGLCSYKFEQVLASYIKITVTKGSIIDNKSHYLAEVMAYGTPYNGSRDGMTVTVGKYEPYSSSGSSGNTVQIVIIVISSAIILISVALTVIFTVIRKKR